MRRATSTDTSGQVAIVTGGASGIGLALCRALVSRGLYVVLADVRGEAASNSAEDVTVHGPGTAEPVAIDVADPHAVAHLVRSTVSAHGRLDLMFNNAGVAVSGEPQELTLAHWNRALDVNVRGIIHGCHAAYPVMLHQGSGHIVNTASLAGLVPSAGGMTPYGMSKYAVVGLTLGLRAAATGTGVGVHVVCPGVVETPMLDNNAIPGLPTALSAEDLDIRQFFRDAGFKRFGRADRVAGDILRGITQDRAIIVCPVSARAMWWLARWAPGFALGRAVRATRIARAQRPARVGSAA